MYKGLKKSQQRIRRLRLKLKLYSFLHRYLRLCLNQSKILAKINRLTNKIEQLEYECSRIMNLKSLTCSLETLYKAPTSYFPELVNKTKNKILIIGRDRTGDSLAKHTQTFLLSLNYRASVVHFYDEYTHELYNYFGVNEYVSLGKCYITHLDGRNYDMMIFCNVLSYNLDKVDSYIPFYKPLISYAYPVFDGTIPPRNWVNAINNNFDAVLVPVDALKKIFEQNGTFKPVFTLPLALDLRDHLASNLQHDRQVFTFGWIGSFEDRKNPIKIINAFRRAFDGDKRVKLRMHTRFIDTRTQDGCAIQQIYKTLPENIEFTHCLLSDEQNIKLMQSFDAYVYVSKGEGYSISPREAMACGHIIILSDIPTHKCITTLDEDSGVFWCHAMHEVPAVQPSLANQVCGVMYDIEEDELVELMQKVYAQKDKLLTPKLVRQRQEVAKQYDLEHLRSVCRQLTYPYEVIKANDNSLYHDMLATNDNSLYEKYRYYMKKRAHYVKVLPMRDAGFFSLFNQYMSHLNYAEEHEMVIPDWRVSKLEMNVLECRGETQFKHFCYGSETEGNIFLQLFEPPYPATELSGELYQTDLLYTLADEIIPMNDMNEKREPNLTYIHSYDLYHDPAYFPIFRQKYHTTLRKHIHLREPIRKIIDDFYEAKLKGYLVISIHVRCQSHALELLGGSPAFEDYAHKIEQILQENHLKPSADTWRLFIATDNEDALNYFTARYPHNIVFQTNITRLTSAQEDEYRRVREEQQKDVEGFELQRRMAANSSNWSLKNGIDILTDAYLLAKGDYFIFQNSNIATAVSYLNPQIKMVYVTDIKITKNN